MSTGPMQLWVVSQAKSFTAGGWALEWDLGGVFSSEEKARAVCTQPGDSYWTVTLDEDLGRETTPPPNQVGIPHRPEGAATDLLTSLGLLPAVEEP